MGDTGVARAAVLSVELAAPLQLWDSDRSPSWRQNHKSFFSVMRSDAQSRAGVHLPGMSIRVAVVVGRRNRSASGPRPQRCT